MAEGDFGKNPHRSGHLGNMASICSADSEIGWCHRSRGMGCKHQEGPADLEQAAEVNTRLSRCSAGTDLGRPVLRSSVHLLPEAKQRGGESTHIPGASS